MRISPEIWAWLNSAKVKRRLDALPPDSTNWLTIANAIESVGIMGLTLQQKLDRITAYQKCGHVHPLTCGTSSLHQNLEPRIRGGQVILVCLDCDYIQTWVPELIYEVDVAKLKPLGWLKPLE